MSTSNVVIEQDTYLTGIHNFGAIYASTDTCIYTVWG